MKTYSVIMAGGGGTRFWPLSTTNTPKQLLNLSGKDTMINETIDRFSFSVAKENQYIITNKSQVKKMLEVTKGKLNPSHILAEPVGRNTAACIGYAAIKILKEQGDGVMVVTPSDAYVKDTKEFNKVLAHAIKEAEKTSEIVTIGITPTFAATGYGYIHYVKSNDVAKKVIKFVEKPEQSKADEYFASGEYAWNSGIFVWKASTVIKKIKELLPDIYEKLLTIEKSIGSPNEEQVLEEVYPTIQAISIDYGVMEKSNDIWVIPGEFGWNDVGSWDMMSVLHDSDKDGNIVIGDFVGVDTKNSIIYSSTKPITTVGVDNLVIVETPETIMVCPKDKAQEVKKIVDELKKRGKNNLL